jgi:hypothetical protein
VTNIIIANTFINESGLFIFFYIYEHMNIVLLCVNFNLICWENCSLTGGMTKSERSCCCCVRKKNEVFIIKIWFACLPDVSSPIRINNMPILIKSFLFASINYLSIAVIMELNQFSVAFFFLQKFKKPFKKIDVIWKHTLNNFFSFFFQVRADKT